VVNANSGKPAATGESAMQIFISTIENVFRIRTGDLDSNAI